MEGRLAAALPIRLLLCLFRRLPAPSASCASRADLIVLEAARHAKAKFCPATASFRSAAFGSFNNPAKRRNLAREHCDGAAVPLYYFETEGPSWSDYQDDDGIELRSDAEALVYAYSIVRELKTDYKSSHRPRHLLVKDCDNTIFRVAFE